MNKEFKLLEKLYNLSNDLICVTDNEGKFIKANPAFSSLLKYPENFLLGKSFEQFVHPDDISKTREVLGELSKGEEISRFENRWRHFYGHYVVLEWSAIIGEDENVYAVARDMTYSIYKESKFRQIYEALSSIAIIAITDKRGIITKVNEQFCKISGYSEEELLGKNHRILNSGLHSKDFFQEMWSTILSGKTWSKVITNKRKDNSLYSVQTIITPIFDNQDEIDSFLSIRIDVTEEENLRKNIDHILKVLNETGSIAKVGGWELIVETGELNWTDETFKILEVEKKEGQKPVLPEGLELFVPEHKPIIENAVNRAIEFGEPYSLELKALTAKGNVIWVYTNGKANYKDGKVVSLSGTIQNIHEKKLNQIKLEEEKTKTMQASKLATLGEMAASIAHEIKNPLSIISTSISLLDRKTHLDETSQKMTQQISVAVDRIAKIVNGLNKFSRNSKNNEKTDLSMSTIIEDSINLSSPKVAKNFVKVFNEVKTDAIVKCNDIEIEQVLINLISNAIDGINDFEDKWIKIKSKEDHQNIKIYVIDAGKGIADDVLDKLFDPFFTTKKVGEGTGLGLSISCGIAEDHGGSLNYELYEGHTSFVLTLPKL